MKNSQIIKTIISCRDKNCYISDSIFLKSFAMPMFLVFWAILLPLLWLASERHFTAQMSAYLFDSVPDGYNTGKGILISRYHPFRSSECSGKIRVCRNFKHRDMSIRLLSCSAREGDVIRFIYPKDDPSKIIIADGHASFVFLIIFSVYMILVAGFHLTYLFSLVIIWRRRMNTVKSPDAGPLRLKLERYKSWRERDNDSLECTVISDLGPRKKLLMLMDKDVYWVCGESRFETLVFKNRTRVSHLYGIRENELRKFAGLPTVSTSGKEKERRIYFAGPWISQNKRPDENMNIWFSDGRDYDYFMTPSDINGFDLLFPKHRDKKGHTR